MTRRQRKRVRGRQRQGAHNARKRAATQREGQGPYQRTPDDDRAKATPSRSFNGQGPQEPGV